MWSCSAGENIILHPTEATPEESHEASSSTTAKNPVSAYLSSLSKAYAESENPVIQTFRNMTSSVSSFLLDETETAKVNARFKALDPTYQQEMFLKELRDYIVPEIVDAFVSMDTETLKKWLSEAVRPCHSLSDVKRLMRVLETAVHDPDVHFCGFCQGKLSVRF